MNTLTASFAVSLGLYASTGMAQDADTIFIFNGAPVTITRSAVQTGAFVPAQDDPCGEGCVAPLQVASNIQTFDEAQVLAFLVEVVATDQGLMVDARKTPSRSAGFIPGTVSLPYVTLADGSRYTTEILRALGARDLDGVFNFADARTLLVYDTGPSSDAAGALVKNLLASGYPAEKIKYYRGGMQVWSMLGFTVQKGQS